MTDSVNCYEHNIEQTKAKGCSFKIKHHIFTAEHRYGKANSCCKMFRVNFPQMNRGDYKCSTSEIAKVMYHMRQGSAVQHEFVQTAETALKPNDLCLLDQLAMGFLAFLSQCGLHLNAIIGNKYGHGTYSSLHFRCILSFLNLLGCLFMVKCTYCNLFCTKPK